MKTALVGKKVLLYFGELALATNNPKKSGLFLGKSIVSDYNGHFSD